MHCSNSFVCALSPVLAEPDKSKQNGCNAKNEKIRKEENESLLKKISEL